MSIDKVSYSFYSFVNENKPVKISQSKKISKYNLNKSIGIGTNDDDNIINSNIKFDKNALLSSIYNNSKANYKKKFIDKELRNKKQFFINQKQFFSDSSRNSKPFLKINSNKFINNSTLSNISTNNDIILNTSSKSKSIFNANINNININYNINNSFNNNNTYLNNKLSKKLKYALNIDEKNNEINSNILNNKYLKTHFTLHPQIVSIKHNIISFKKKKKRNIVFDNKSLIGSLLNQTNSNFNNKYKIKFYSNNNRKREQIKYCFNLFKNGKNLSLINELLNKSEKKKCKSPDQSTFSYRSDNNFKLKKIKETNLTINSLEKTRPLTSINFKHYNKDN